MGPLIATVPSSTLFFFYYEKLVFIPNIFHCHYSLTINPPLFRCLHILHSFAQADMTVIWTYCFAFSQ